MRGEGTQGGEQILSVPPPDSLALNLSPRNFRLYSWWRTGSEHEPTPRMTVLGEEGRQGREAVCNYGFKSHVLTGHTRLVIGSLKRAPPRVQCESLMFRAVTVGPRLWAINIRTGFMRIIYAAPAVRALLDGNAWFDRVWFGAVAVRL